MFGINYQALTDFQTEALRTISECRIQQINVDK